MNTSDFFTKVKHYRTTIAGAFTILGTLATFVAGWVASGEIPGTEKWELLGGGLTVGAGLIASADAKAVNAEATKIKTAMLDAGDAPK